MNPQGLRQALPRKTSQAVHGGALDWTLDVDSAHTGSMV